MIQSLSDWLDLSLVVYLNRKDIEQVVNVLLIRSIYNLVASRIQQKRYPRTVWRRELLGQWKYLVMNKPRFDLVVHYDHLIAEEGYEQLLRNWITARTMRVPLPEVALGQLAIVDTFTRRKRGETPPPTDELLHRYRHHLEHPDMVEVLQDDDARLMNLEEFGWALDKEGKRIDAS
jgi:hypothetical protein